MLKSYFKIALRNLRKQPTYTIINVLGLSIAIAAGLLITLYVRHELSFDRFHARIDRIYQIAERSGSSEDTYLLTRARLLPAVLEDFPTVESGTRLLGQSVWITHGDRRFFERGLYVDSTFFEVFSFPLLAGDPQTVLQSRDAVVISEHLARKYFGQENPVGRTISVNFRDVHTITGVMRSFPANSTLQGDFLLPYTNLDWEALNWSNTNTPTVLLLAGGSRPARVEAQIEDLLAERDPPDRKAAVELFPFHEVHLGTQNGTIGETGKRTMLSILTGIAFAILLIAAINFANLATARSLTRMREIGVRKVLGAGRAQLVRQFLGEALLTSYAATLLGAALADVLLPLFNHLLNTALTLDYLGDPATALILLLIGTGVGLLSGIYPALYLSRFNPAATLKGRLQQETRGAFVRNGLVVTQFSFSIALIIGTLVVWSQIEYMKSRDLHFDANGVLVVSLSPYHFEDPEAGQARIETMTEELLRHHRISAVSASRSIPGDYDQWGASFAPEGSNLKVQANWTLVDGQYFSVYGIDLLEGRSFSDSLASEAWSKAVINETARRAFGLSSAAGQVIQFGRGPVEIIGVAEDFHYTSLEREIEPVVHLYPGPGTTQYRRLSIKITPGPVQPVLAYIQEQLHALDPSRTFDYYFADAHFDGLYQEVERRGLLAGSFALLAVLIACMGLLGLASYATVQRTKEIGIRKVLGASVLNIVALLSKGFLKLVLIAFLVAAPLAYLGMSRWLEDFAYRIQMSPGLFLLAGLAALAIAFATVSYQAAKAAAADPVKSLRYE